MLLLCFCSRVIMLASVQRSSLECHCLVRRRFFYFTVSLPLRVTVAGRFSNQSRFSEMFIHQIIANEIMSVLVIVEITNDVVQELAMTQQRFLFIISGTPDRGASDRNRNFHTSKAPIESQSKATSD